MIVRDEEDNLSRALASVKDLVDEIIVVDTGSNDRTVEVAERFGARVFNHPWQGSFSESRNISLKYATKDWILILDADEAIPEEDHPAIRTLLDRTDYDGYYFLNLQLQDEEGTVSSQHYNLRLFRNGLGIRYEGRVHNQPNLPEDRIQCTDIRIRHYGYMKGYSRKTSKYLRSATLLEKELELNPEAHHFRFHLGSLYFLLDRYDEGMRQLEMAAERAENAKYRAKSYLMLGYMYLKNGELETALPCFDRALEIVPGFCEAQFLKAEAKRLSGELNEAIELYRQIIKAPRGQLDAYSDMKDNRHIREIMAPWKRALSRWTQGDKQTPVETLTRLSKCAGTLAWKIILDLGDMLFDSGKFHEALSKYREAAENNSTAWEPHLKLGLIHMNLGETESGEKEFLEAYNLNQEEPVILMNLGGLRMRQGRFQEAVNLFDKVFARVPDQVDALFNKALALEHLERYAPAEDCYRKLSRIIPDHPLLFERWADFCRRVGKQDKVPHLLGKVLRLEPNRYDLRLTRAHTLLGLARKSGNLRYLKEASVEVEKILQAGVPEATEAVRLLEEIKKTAASASSS